MANNVIAMWEEMRVAALLGTGRQPYVAPAGDRALGEAFARLRERDTDAQLLGTVAIAALFEHAGRVPPADSHILPEPAPSEALPECSVAFAQRLAMMLGGTHRDVLPEALALLARGKKRVPAILLPELLNVARDQRALREKAGAIIGERGRWLAAQNPDWNFAAGPSLQSSMFDLDSIAAAWETADKASRVSLLSEMRERDPDRARELLAHGFAGEGADERARLLAVLATGLNHADEPFLEQVLGDRGKEVRRVAAELLARIPGSAYCVRMADRARGLLRMRRKFIGQVLEVNLPERFDPVWQRDGIEEKPPSSLIGERAWWLAQMVGMAPLSIWRDHLGETPERLVTLAAGSDWADALLLGWGRASRRHADPAWAEPIARYWARRPNRGAYPQEMIPTTADLGERTEGQILYFLREGGEPLHDSHPALHWIANYEQPWSEGFVRDVIGSIKARVAAGAGKDKHAWQLQQNLRRFALYVPVHLADELTADWPSDDSQWYNWKGPIEDFSAKLHFRRELHKEITQ